MLSGISLFKRKNIDDFRRWNTKLKNSTLSYLSIYFVFKYLKSDESLDSGLQAVVIFLFYTVTCLTLG